MNSDFLEKFFGRADWRPYTEKLLIEKYHEAFIDQTSHKYSNAGDSFSYSNKAVMEATTESIRDFVIMAYRRMEDSDIQPSPGKFAGIITYRFSKARLVHSIEPALQEDSSFLRLDHQIAVRLGLLYLGMDCIDRSRLEKVINELIYSLTRRHVNQETIGLIYDSVVDLEKIRK